MQSALSSTAKPLLNHANLHYENTLIPHNYSHSHRHRPPQHDLPMAKPLLGPEDYYSNSDIQILHEIVKAAQFLLDTLPETECIPTSALFRAYDDILPRHGIDPDDDHHFSRILFRIGGERGSQPLIRKFEVVLDRMGIQIVFDDVTGAVTTEYPLRNRRQSLTTVPEEPTDQIQAEESSYENGSAQTAASPQIPEISHSSPDDTHEFATPKPVAATAVTLPPREIPKTATWLMEARRQMRDLGLDDTEANKESDASDEESDAETHGPEEDADDAYEPTVPMLVKTVPPSGPLPHKPPTATSNRAPGPAPRPAPHYSPIQDTIVSRAPAFEHVATRVVPDPLSPTQTTQPSHVLRRLDANLDEMDARAQLAHDFHVLTEATRLFRWWRDKAKSLPATDEYYEAMAMTEQRRCTIQITMMQWQDHAAYLRQQRIEEAKAAHKQREYNRIERVATRAGQIYLVTNNFAVWLAHAKAEAERIAVARRHILRKRHFDNWKRLTSSYIAMSQAFIMTLNFGKWADIAAEAARNQRKADVLCSSRIANTALREWKREAKERLVDEHRNRNICSRAMKHWLTATAARMTVEDGLEVKYRVAVAEKTMAVWKSWAETKPKQWHRGSHLMAYNQVSDVFGVWRNIDVEAHLQPVYDGNLAADALRDWNLEGKCRWMQGSINHKLRSVAFRDWNLLQRMALFQRQKDQAVKEHAFACLLDHSKAIAEADSQPNILQSARQAGSRILETCLLKWASASTLLSRADAVVSRREAKDMLLDCMSEWKHASRCQPEMRRWSSRGEYFLATSRHFLPWVERSRQVRRERLAAAFTKGRALQKERLVQRCWQLWDAGSQRAKAQTQRCKAARRKRDRYLVTSSLDSWLAACAQLDDIDESVEVDNAQRMFSSALALWLDQADVRNTNDTTSWALWAHQTVTEAWECWDVAMEAVEEKHANAPRREKKRLSRLVHHEFLTWLDAASEARTPPLLWPAQTPPAAAPVFLAAPNSIAQLSARAQPALAHTAPRPAPALAPDFADVMAHTPTRRTGLARSVAALSSTTPSMALSTPYERELRAIYHGGESVSRAASTGMQPAAPLASGLSVAQRQPLRIALFQSRRRAERTALDDLDEEPVGDEAA
ncbi:uncharacterized protein BROUX77_007185 [Berkeleyomyces rouxiae]|uniref:uncharacterized protein n=1 Tax=Berkeleyomyces rouxiae TaxID=2035830 RepID=UPI003B783247